MKPCTKCGVSQSLDSYYKKNDSNDGKTSWCRSCMNAAKKEWHRKKYYPGSPYQQQVLEEQKQSRLANIDMYRASMKIRKYRYKAKKFAADGVCTPEQLLARVEYYGGKCYMCNNDYQAIDHVKPISKGGSNWPANLRPICHKCNRAKSNKWPLSLAEAYVKTPQEALI